MEFKTKVWYKGYKGFDSQMHADGIEFKENGITDKTEWFVDPYIEMHEEPLDAWLECPPGVDELGEPREYTEVGACGSLKIKNPSVYDTIYGIKLGRKITTSQAEIGKKMTLRRYIHAAIEAAKKRIEKSNKPIRFTTVKKRSQESERLLPSIMFAVHDCSEAYEESCELPRVIAANTGVTAMSGTSGASSVAACTGHGSVVVNQSSKPHSATGSTAVATGALSVARTEAIRSAAVVTGACSAAESTRDHAAALCVGPHSAAHSTGDRSAAVATADSSRAEFNGSSKGLAAAMADESVAIVKCRQGIAAAVSSKSIAKSRGRASVAITTGKCCKASLDPNSERSMAVATGEHSKTSADGKNNIAFAAGHDCIASGALNNWIVCVEWKPNGEILDIKSAKVDGVYILPDTYYRLEAGEFVKSE